MIKYKLMLILTTIFSFADDVHTSKTSLYMGSAVLSNMVIFTDVGYWYIGLLGAVVSVISENRNYANGLYQQTSKLQVVSWAFIIGLLVTMIMFFVLSSMGEELLKHFSGISVTIKFLPSLAMLITVVLSTQSVKIFNKLVDRGEKLL